MCLLKTFFNWLNEDQEVLDGRNPVNMVRKSPRTTKVIDVLVKLESIGRILKVHQIQRGIEVPIIESTHFLVCTRADLEKHSMLNGRISFSSKVCGVLFLNLSVQLLMDWVGI